MQITQALAADIPTDPETLTAILAARSRPLPIALAHCFARTKAGDEGRLALLNGLFGTLTQQDQFVCRAEIHECRAARHGERLAMVV